MWAGGVFLVLFPWPLFLSLFRLSMVEITTKNIWTMKSASGADCSEGVKYLERRKISIFSVGVIHPAASHNQCLVKGGNIETEGFGLAAAAHG